MPQNKREKKYHDDPNYSDTLPYLPLNFDKVI